MEVLLIRGAGDSYEEVLENPLAADVATKIQLGRNYLDDNALPVTDFDVKVLYRDAFRTGTVVQVESALTGEQFLAKITGISHTVESSDRGRVTSTVLRLAFPEQ